MSYPVTLILTLSQTFLLVGVWVCVCVGVCMRVRVHMSVYI